jgi:hypothetical protein
MTFRTFHGRFLAFFLSSVATLGGAALAHAQPTAADISTAKQAFESAVVLENERHWAEAAVELRQAIAIKDTPGLRFHLAHCEVEQGHLVAASVEYDRAARLLRQGVKAPDVQKLLGPVSAALEARIPRLTVELPLDLSAPSAALDGKPYPSSELALGVPLDPGRHVLRVTAEGRRPFEQVLVLSEGQPETVRPQLAVAAPPITSAAPRRRTVPPISAPVRSSSDDSGSSAKLYLLIGESVLTVAGLGVGIGGQLLASSASDRVGTAQTRIDDASGGEGSACNRAELSGACRDLQDAIGDHDNALTLSKVGFISAGVGAIALVTTWLAYPNSAPRASAARVYPVATFGRIGLVGSF